MARFTVMLREEGTGEPVGDGYDFDTFEEADVFAARAQVACLHRGLRVEAGIWEDDELIHEHFVPKVAAGWN